MEWFKVFTQFIGILIWPMIVLTLTLLFRKEIRRYVIKKATLKTPGGQLEVEVARLEDKVEKKGRRLKKLIHLYLL